MGSGIYIGPGAIRVINNITDPQIHFPDTVSMNDNLIVVFRAFNTSSGQLGQWGIYRGSAVPLVEEGGPVITNLGSSRAVINNSGTVAFYGVDVTGRNGIYKTDDGVNFTFVGGGSGSNDAFSINNNGAVAYPTQAGSSWGPIFIGPSPANRVIGPGDALDGSTVLAAFIWYEALNDNGQVAFYVQLADNRQGIFRADPNRPPIASNGTASVTAGASVQGTLSATDPDGDSLTYSIVTNGTQGTAVITDTGTGALTYTANVGSSGTDTFTFKANDGFVDSNTATITVTITPPGPCATDISATVAVTSQGPLKLNKKTGRYIQALTLKNGDGAVSGSVSLALDSLSSNATLFNATGTTACAAPSGSPYINVDVGTNSVFDPRERATVTLEFTNPSGQAVTYTNRVLAGANR